MNDYHGGLLADNKAQVSILANPKGLPYEDGGDEVVITVWSGEDMVCIALPHKSFAYALLHDGIVRAEPWAWESPIEEEDISDEEDEH